MCELRMKNRAPRRHSASGASLLSDFQFISPRSVHVQSTFSPPTIHSQTIISSFSVHTQFTLQGGRLAVLRAKKRAARSLWAGGWAYTKENLSALRARKKGRGRAEPERFPGGASAPDRTDADKETLTAPGRGGVGVPLSERGVSIKQAGHEGSCLYVVGSCLCVLTWDNLPDESRVAVLLDVDDG